MELKKHLQTLFLATFFILLSGLNTRAQQIYASNASEVSLGNHVDNTSNAAAANGKFATINSYGGVSPIQEVTKIIIFSFLVGVQNLYIPIYSFKE